MIVDDKRINGKILILIINIVTYHAKFERLAEMIDSDSDGKKGYDNRALFS